MKEVTVKLTFRLPDHIGARTLREEIAVGVEVMRDCLEHHTCYAIETPKVKVEP